MSERHDHRRVGLCTPKCSICFRSESAARQILALRDQTAAPVWVEMHACDRECWVQMNLLSYKDIEEGEINDRQQKFILSDFYKDVQTSSRALAQNYLSPGVALWRNLRGRVCGHDRALLLVAISNWKQRRLSSTKRNSFSRAIRVGCWDRLTVNALDYFKGGNHGS